MRMHQESHVGAAQGAASLPLPQPGVAAVTQSEQAHRLGGHGRGDPPTPGSGKLPAPWWGVQPNPEGCLAVSLHLQARRCRGGRRDSWAKVDLRQQKGVLHRPEKGIHGLHQARRGAPVMRQVETGVGRGARLQENPQVGAAEAVDGLLGVAHHEPETGLGMLEYALQDLVLHLVGVLEFVH